MDLTEDVSNTAKKIIQDFSNIILEDGNYLDTESVKKCSLIMVDKLIEVTRSSFWYRVREFIESFQ